MAEIIWTEEAERWLKDIYGYIAQDNPEAAATVIEGIYQRAQVLVVFPEIGHKYRSEPEGDIRILLYGHYRIAYLIRGWSGSIFWEYFMVLLISTDTCLDQQCPTRGGSRALARARAAEPGRSER